MTQKTFADLRDTLASIYPDNNSIQRIMDESGINTSHVNLNSTPKNNWHNVLREAEKSGQIDILLDVVKREYPDHKGLTDASNTYKQLRDVVSNPTSISDRSINDQSNGKKSNHKQNDYTDTRLSFLSILLPCDFHRRVVKKTGIFYFIITLVIGSIIITIIAIYPQFQSTSHLPRCPIRKICIITAPISQALNDTSNSNTADAIKEAVDEILEPLDGKKSIQILTTTIPIKVADVDNVINQTNADLLILGQLDNQNLYFNKRLRIDQYSVLPAFRIQPILLYNHISFDNQCLLDVCIDTLNNQSGQEKQQVRAMIYATLGLAYYNLEIFSESSNFFQYALYCMQQPSLLNGTALYAIPEYKTSCSNLKSQGDSSNYEESFASLNKDCSINSSQVSTNQKVIEVDPLLYLLYYFSGKSLVQLGNYSAGIKYLVQATQYNLREPATLISIADAYSSWLEVSDSLPSHVTELLDCADKKFDYSASQGEKHLIDYTKGLINELKHKWEDAEIIYQDTYDQYFKSHDLDPYVILMALARVEKQQGKLDEAIEHLKLAKNVTESYDVLFELADSYQKKADPTKQSSDILNYENIARSYLNQAQTIEPTEYYKIRVQIAQSEFCYKTKKDGCTCAISPDIQVNEEWPNVRWLNSKIGDCFRRIGDWDNAANYFMESIKPNSQDPWAHDRLAYTLLQLGKYEDALLHYQHAIDFAHPEYIPERLYIKRKEALCNIYIVNPVCL